MDQEAVNQALIIDPDWEAEARQSWLAAMDLAVWGDLRSSRLGAMARLRKRVLEVGEKLKSLVADRAWIPHPRERLKNALASGLNFRESLGELERAAGSIDGGCDLEAFGAALKALRRANEKIGPLENSWARLLDAQYSSEEE
jgi:hypothetical protein